MSEQSAKPFLVRALYEWCVEQGYTPYLAVRVDAKTRVPTGFVKNGEIVLNVGPLATHQLTMDNDWVLFNARFNGESQEVAVPFAAVIGIFAKETGYGMGFQPTLDAAGSDATDGEISPAIATAAPAKGKEKSKPSLNTSTAAKSKATHLKVIK
jgi:stringent starvation protein B